LLNGYVKKAVIQIETEAQNKKRAFLGTSLPRDSKEVLSLSQSYE
jgi:hypothetical protein